MATRYDTPSFTSAVLFITAAYPKEVPRPHLSTLHMLTRERTSTDTPLRTTCPSSSGFTKSTTCGS